MPLLARAAAPGLLTGFSEEYGLVVHSSLRQTAKEPRVGHQPIPRLVERHINKFCFPRTNFPRNFALTDDRASELRHRERFQELRPGSKRFQTHTA
jgi:hypothetical protein